MKLRLKLLFYFICSVVPLVCLNSALAEDLDFKFFGFLKTSYLVSDASIASFGKDSWQAPTEVQNLDSTTTEQTQDFKRRTKSDPQIAQSRLGLRVSRSEHMLADFEFDLVDFSNNAIAISDTRVRRAELIYAPSEQLAFRAGQGWTTFASDFKGPHTYNIVGNNFRAGASGFLSQQIEASYSIPTSGLKLFTALSYKGRNTTGVPTTSGSENNASQNAGNLGLPAVILKAEYQPLDTKHTIGLASIYSSFDWDDELNAPITSSATESYGGKIYSQFKLTKLEIRQEAYWGQNLSDLFLLTLAESNLGASPQTRSQLQEFGYFLSAKYELLDELNIYGNFGAAEIDESSSRLRSNVLKANRVLRLGASYTPLEYLELFFEGMNFGSTYSAVTDDQQTFDAWMAETGFVYRF